MLAERFACAENGGEDHLLSEHSLTKHFGSSSTGGHATQHAQLPVGDRT
jgi:hypothetical protein